MNADFDTTNDGNSIRIKVENDDFIKHEIDDTMMGDLADISTKNSVSNVHLSHFRLQNLELPFTCFMVL